MLRRTSYQRRSRKQRGEQRSAETTCGAGAWSNDSSASVLPLPPPKARGVAPTRWRNDGTWGEGRKKPVPFIVRANRPAPPRPAPSGARARPTLTFAHARAELAARSGAHAPEGRRWLSLRLFCCFPEKFLERRRPREAGGWGAQGSERLRESETSKTHRHRPASIHHAMAKAKPETTETLTPGEKAWGLQQPLLSLPVPSPEAPDHGEKGEGRGSDEKPKTLTGGLRGGVKADIRSLELPAHSWAARGSSLALERGLRIGILRGYRSTGLGLLNPFP